MSLPVPRPDDWLELTRPGQVTIQHAGLLVYGDESIQMLDRVAASGKGVLFFSLGRSERSVAADLLCRRAGIKLGETGPKVFSPQEMDRLRGIGDEIQGEDLHIVDDEDLGLDSMERIIRDHPGVEFVIIDSMELMDSPMRTEGRIKGFARLVGQLRKRARRIGVAILAFRRPQFFRDLETRGDELEGGA